ncbi:hypothetical protein NQ315_006949 [Exocentrus adspersus]|uniref:Uncharacterized protein n=1 Tax=Exocentrus adspersus TaxID=1586481 RepID=A0AAV8WD66_9CUCU|nr:hypothetical protein NQ315_006949 [Exocentrus adspersus]
MKIVFVVSALIALAASDHPERFLDLQADMEKFLEECSKETSLSHDEVNAYLVEDGSENDDKSSKYIMCFFKKRGVVDDDGNFDLDKAREAVKEYMKEVHAEDDAEALECVQEKDTAEDTGLALAKCVQKRRVELEHKK